MLEWTGDELQRESGRLETQLIALAMVALSDATEQWPSSSACSA